MLRDARFDPGVRSCQHHVLFRRGVRTQMGTFLGEVLSNIQVGMNL